MGLLLLDSTALSARVAKLREAGLKEAKTTVLELMVLMHMEKHHDKLRKRVDSKYKENMGKLQNLGYGPDDIPVDDPSIPQDVCVWLVDYRKCADLKDQVDELSAELVDEPEDEKMKKGPDVGEHQLSLRKRKGDGVNTIAGESFTCQVQCEPKAIISTLALTLSARVAKLADAGVKAAKTTMLELNVLLHLEDVYTELREQIIVRRAEMVGKLKDMGYGPEDIPLGDPNIPEDVRRWLRDYKEHVDLKEHTTRLRADIAEEPWAEAPLLEKLLQGLPHAVSRKMTLQSQGDGSTSHDPEAKGTATSPTTPPRAHTAKNGGKKQQ